MTALAEDGETGLHFADYHHPSAIVLDIGLPGMDGWEVLRELKADPATQENVKQLAQRGVLFIGPDSGEQACGDVGEGGQVGCTFFKVWHGLHEALFHGDLDIVATP